MMRKILIKAFKVFLFYHPKYFFPNNICQYIIPEGRFFKQGKLAVMASDPSLHGKKMGKQWTQ